MKSKNQQQEQDSGARANAAPAAPQAAAEPVEALTREQVEEQMCDYMAAEAAQHGTPWSAIARHLLGLRHGLPGARKWRQVWSDHRLKALHPRDVMALAHGAVREAA